MLLFERLIESSDVVRLLDQHNFLAHYAIVVFGHSRFLGDTLIQNPDLLASFLRERNLDRSLSQEEFHETLARFRARSSESDVAVTLARFKRREYVRIMLHDVNWLGPQDVPFEARVKVRSMRPPVAATVTPLEGGAARVELAEPEEAIAPGQACVFYGAEDRRVLGGGWITGSGQDRAAA